MTMSEPVSLKLTMHASCVALGDAGVLILGPSGSGKSDLVLALIDQPGYGLGAALLRGKLVADDQTLIERRGDGLFASSPQPIAGLLEIRGQGIIAVDHLREVRLALVVRLMPAVDIERMPETETSFTSIAGIELREIRIDPSWPTASARIRAALTARLFGEVRQIRPDVA
jgi:HPr kinase/phosphorylase